MEGNTLQKRRGDRDAAILSEPAQSSSTVTAKPVAPVRELKLADVKIQKPAHLETQAWSLPAKLGIVLFALFWLCVVGAHWSHAEEQSGGEYSFKWLDPEKKIYVLQNRKYLKAEHANISVLGGPGFSNSYRNTFSLEPRFSYYFSEDWGIELFYSKVFNSQSNTYKALVSTGTSVFPVIREVRSEMGALVQWVPWYAKINVFNSILYFDWYFSGGLGTVNTAVTTGTTQSDLNNYVSDNELGMYFGTGHLYHLNETFTVRLDFMGTYYKAPLTGQTGDKVWFTNYDFTAGLGIRL